MVRIPRYTPWMAVRAVVGARVSHVQGEEKTSHITQRGTGQAYAERQGWEVVGAVEDLDVSAIKLSPWERPDLREWLDREGDWDALIFAKTDRVFRSANDCVKLAEWCREHHKILVLVDDGIRLDYYHPEDEKDAFSGAMSKVFLILASVFAELEGQRFVQRARDRVSFLRGTDRWGYGAPPFGFRIAPHPSGRGKALEIDVEAREVLSGVVTRFLAGDSLTAVARGLNSEGVLSPKDWARSRAGQPTQGTEWSVGRLKDLLSNPITRGIKTYKEKVVLDGDGQPVRVGPELIGTETWGQIQLELAHRSREPRTRRHSANPLLGVAKCGAILHKQDCQRDESCDCPECQQNLHQRAKTMPSGIVHRYYSCGRTPQSCHGVSIVAADAEKLVEETFLEDHHDRKIHTRVWVDGSDCSAELEQTNRTIESLREDRAMGLFTTPVDELTFRQQMTALLAKRGALELMPVTKSGWTDVETNETYGEVWPTATVEQKRKMLTDAGVTLTVTSPRQRHLHIESLLGQMGEQI